MEAAARSNSRASSSRSTGPSRRSSSAAASSSIVSVPTPSRDLSLRNGAFKSNVLRLEQSAEEMSAAGSDIGEEIRRIVSRQNSIQYSHQEDNNNRHTSARSAPLDVPHRSRTSSYGNSIVDVNNSARAGGYSPGGYLTSPVGSVRTGSWSQISMPRKVSTSSSASKLAQMMEPSQEGVPLDSTSNNNSAMEDSSRIVSQTSFGRRYDEIAGEIVEQLEGVPPVASSQMTIGGGHDGASLAQEKSERAATPLPRPSSADTFQQAQTMFRDFDGVHYKPDTEEYVEIDENGNQIRRVSARNSSATLSVGAPSLLRVPPTLSYVAPPPEDGMIYYPAPVPRMLNLPKRLSQLPSASVQAKRRTQALDQLAPESRKSAAWLPDLSYSDTAQRDASGSTTSSVPRGQLNQRVSSSNVSNLPPHLRASAFFDQPSVRHDVEVAGESAVATLDSILAASATAPVSAFTDHPFAGDVSKTLFAPERRGVRSSSNLTHMLLNQNEKPEADKKRRTSLGGLLSRVSSTDELTNFHKRRGSRSSTLLDFNEGGKKLQKRRSQMSLGDPLDLDDSQAMKTPASELDQSGGEPLDHAQNVGRDPDRGDETASRAVTAMSGRMLDEGEQVQHDFQEQEAQEDIEDDGSELSFAQPTTLLAELQVRKAQLKSRNRTAATAFPNGMHSTLLQLDAVAEIDKKKRQNQRIALAWEDPSLKRLDMEKREEDEDVPLGMLFPGKNGLANRKMGDAGDWNRPLGLMDKREMEDNEPLSSRRARMRGEPMPRPRQRSLEKTPSENGDEGVINPDPVESLAQRLRRLRTKDALDSAISDVAPKDGSRPLSTFTDEVFSQFRGTTRKDTDAKPGAPTSSSPLDTTAPVDIENETLGQRRARLQREREEAASKPAATARPPLQARHSMSNLLSANPIVATASAPTSRTHVPTQGTLLFASAQAKAEQRRSLLDSNKRSSSLALDRPLIDPLHSARPAFTSNTGLIGAQNTRAPSGGFAGGVYNNIAGGLQSSFSSPMLATGPVPNAYFASPTSMAMAAYPTQAGMLPYAQPAMMSPFAYGMQPQMYPYPGAQMAGIGMGYGMGIPPEQITSQQRDAIDRWRMSVAQ